MGHEETINLFSNWREGDEDAAFVMFERYVNRLTALARSRLSPRMQPRVDPDDIVQSAYRVFFDRASRNEFSLQRTGDLWRLLAAITLKKVQAKVEFHHAQKRSIGNDAGQSDSSSFIAAPMEAVDREPTPDESVALVEEIQYVLGLLDVSQREIVEKRLGGMEVEEIAEAVQRSERTVRRALETVRKLLEERLFEKGSA
jgi:RNA polymerase sigma-70 factor (ECF subfamily)